MQMQIKVHTKYKSHMKNAKYTEMQRMMVKYKSQLTNVEYYEYKECIFDSLETHT